MKLFAFALPDGGLKPLALDQIRRSKTDNDILYADRTDVEVDGSAISVTTPPEATLSQIKATATEMGAEVREEGAGALFLVWRSPAIGFPNAAYAYVEANGEGARVSLYGKALYGRRDFGANKGFIDQLASALNKGS